jgi:hypothetical protein
MTFPVVAGSTSNTDGAGTTSHTVNLPASIAAGDMLIVISGGTISATVTEAGDWDELFEQDSESTITLWGMWRIADGTEGASVVFTTGTSVQWRHISLRITGHSGNAPEALAIGGAAAGGDPPELTPSWGSADTLWLTGVRGTLGVDANPTPPTNYTLVQSNDGGAGAGCVAVARRDSAASSEDPGIWEGGSGISNGFARASVTIGVEPAASSVSLPIFADHYRKMKAV